MHYSHKVHLQDMHFVGVTDNYVYFNAFFQTGAEKILTFFCK